MRYYLLTETAANSGVFALPGDSTIAASPSAALTALQPLVPSGVRFGVWPYREMVGAPSGGASGAEIGQSYLVIEQSSGTAGPFVLTTDEIDSTADLDAGIAAAQRQDRTGLRTGLMLKTAAAASNAPAQQSAPSKTAQAAPAD